MVFRLKAIGISGNLFLISSEFGLFANLPDYLKAARSINKKKPMDILRWVKKIQSVQEVLKIKQGYLGYPFKRTFQTFFKISGFLANHLDNLESARLIKYLANFFFTNLKKSSQSKKFLNTNSIVFGNLSKLSFQTFIKISGLFSNLNISFVSW